MATTSFNPCPRVGGNPGAVEAGPEARLFQSMPPRGGQRGRGRTRIPLLGFNPCPRVGGNDAANLTMRVIKVSIHAPAWGATQLF